MLKIFLQPFYRSYHWLWAYCSAVWYRHPSEKMIVIGVTGTNGKSTVVSLLHEIFFRAGYSVGSVSSIRFKIDAKEQKNELKMTMPGRGFLQKFLARCRKNVCRYAIIEVTSEGIRQFRNAYINFDVAVLTNITPEHIESHGSFEAYRDAKVSFFAHTAKQKRKNIFGERVPKTLVVNLDDREHKHFLVPGFDFSIGYTTKQASEPAVSRVVSAGRFEMTERGVVFSYNGSTMQSRLVGEFNVANMLAAIAVSENYGVLPIKIREAFLHLEKIPGRFEYINEGQRFWVIVDYAHTPDSLEKIYQTAQKLHNNKKIICVLGAAGGGRDAWKRPEFAKIAARFCKEIILTNEDPYDEDPNKILSEIESGISNFAHSAEVAASAMKAGQSQISKIIDRREAIREALKRARPDDVVIITGKGAEPWIMGPRKLKIAWDDRAVAREELKKLLKQ